MTNQLTQSIIEAINKHLSLGSNLKLDEINIESAERVINGEYANAMKLYKELVSDLIVGSNNYTVYSMSENLLESNTNPCKALHLILDKLVEEHALGAILGLDGMMFEMKINESFNRIFMTNSLEEKSQERQSNVSDYLQNIITDLKKTNLKTIVFRLQNTLATEPIRKLM